ncbi:heterokaryon incompatibility protein-domain-containing protein [Xylaria digitata]|nr:heterokaryon incompatibility protein-domain-containing protein [Xylaria digitata]
MPPLYQYTPLNNDGDIRVLELSPASSDDDDIHIRIRSTALKEVNNEFEALSYTWGDIQNTKTISCDETNASLQVSSNCYDALRRLRLKYVARTLWIDAICIDQKNDLERSSQIKIMGRIYATAEASVIFLGDHDPESESLFRYLCNGNGSTRKQSVVRGIEKLFDRPWFSRIWVVQELANAQSASFLCGHDTLPVGTLLDSLYENDDHKRAIRRLPAPISARIEKTHPPPELESSEDPFDFLEFCHNLRMAKCRENTIRETTPIQRPCFDQRFSVSKTPTTKKELPEFTQYSITRSTAVRQMQDLLFKTGLSESTDPRDQIIALIPLLGLQAPEIENLIDYRLKPEEIFYRLARMILDDSGLVLFWMVRHPHNKENMPSWVPDWADKTERIRAVGYFEPFLESYDESEAYKDFGFESESEGRLLRVKGKIRGRIDEVGPILMSGKLDIIEREEVIKKIVAKLESMLFPLASRKYDLLRERLERHPASETDSESIKIIRKIVAKFWSMTFPPAPRKHEHLLGILERHLALVTDAEWAADSESVMDSESAIDSESVMDLEFMEDPESSADLAAVADPDPTMDIDPVPDYPEPIKRGKYNVKRKREVLMLIS